MKKATIEFNPEKKNWRKAGNKTVFGDSVEICRSAMSEQPETREEICGVCGTNAKQKCSSCKLIYYCSREHQKLDWKRHSKICRGFEIAIDSTLGRHYVARRKIEIGSVVLREEKPFLAWPPQGTPPVCLSCYTILKADNSKPCEKCGWPLCNDCKNHDRTGECEFTIKKRASKVTITDFEIPHPTYKSIGVIRALAMRENEPEAYRRLLDLEDHCEEASNQDDDVVDTPKDVANFVKRFFKIDDVSDDEIAKIVGILQVF